MRITIDEAVHRIIRVVADMDDVSDVADVYNHIVGPATLVEIPCSSVSKDGYILSTWTEYELEIQEE